MMNTTNTVRTLALCAIALAMAFTHPTTIHAQQETAIWHFGQRIALNFNIPPASPAGPVLATSAITASEGSAAMCDRVTGQTLFYTNGIFVWDRNDAPMPNAGPGLPLGGGASSTQAALVVPDLVNRNRYYLFTTAQEGSGAAEYSIVDMTLRAGVGDVDPTVRRQPLPTIGGTAPPARVCEKLAGTRDAAGTGYWVAIHEWTALAGGSNRFFVYHISAAGIDIVRISNAGTAILPITSYARGELKFSPDGAWLVAVSEDQVTEVFSFNRTNGAITLASTLASGRQGYGASFSPNSRLLYINDGWNGPGRISQYDVLAGSPVGIASSEIVVGVPVQGNLGGMQIAPDGRIYCTKNSGTSIAAIPCPDVRGTGCGFIDNFLTPGAGRSLTWGLPNLILESVATPLYAGPDDTLCAGDAVRLGVARRQGFTYNWSPATNLDNRTSPQPLANPATNTRYIVAVTSPAGCPSFDTVDLVVNRLPSRATSPDTAICAGTSAQLRALEVAAGTTYAWSPATGLNDPSIAAPIATPTATTTYSVTITSRSGCRDSARITVTVNPVPTATINPASATICNGTSTQLVAAGGSIFAWSPATGLSNPSIPNPLASPLVTTAYQVIVSNGFGCADTANVVVTVNPTPVAGASNDTTICAGNSAMLIASGGTTYSWTPVTGLSNPTSPTPIANPVTTTTYSVEVGNSNGCFDTARVTVTVQTASISIALPDTVGDPHDKNYRLPLRRATSNVPGECSPTLVGLTITFDENLFFPTSVTRGRIASNTVVGGMRIVRLEFAGVNVFDSPVITELVGAVLLGDTVATSLTVDSAQWAGAVVATTLTNGRLRLSPICLEGGPRLLAAQSGATILRVAPNPTRASAVVDVQTMGASTAHLDVYSTSDARVFTTTWANLSTGDADIRQIQLPADLPSGAYRIVLRSAGEITTTLLLVTK